MNQHQSKIQPADGNRQTRIDVPLKETNPKKANASDLDLLGMLTLANAREDVEALLKVSHCKRDYDRLIGRWPASALVIERGEAITPANTAIARAAKCTATVVATQKTRFGQLNEVEQSRLITFVKSLIDKDQAGCKGNSHFLSEENHKPR